MDDEDIASLPIDIHINKLVEWLVSRQHVNKDWAETARSVREKINSAIQDMPEHPDITKLLSGTYINYFHCLQIIDILRETEADSKNILGWYTSQRMKDWQAVQKVYEKGGCGLAESGQLLHRYIAYEIPSINSHMTRCTQVQQDCDKKEADIHKAATNARNAYLRQCKTIGIQGDNIRQEIKSLLSELPTELDRIGAQCSGLKDAVKFYHDFIGFTCNKEFTDSLHMLQYIIEHGNVTTYEYIHGEAPLSIETADIVIEDETTEIKANDGQIDFGDDAPAEIDFGDSGEAEIDFGGSEGAEIDFGEGDIDYGENIDWDAADISNAAITVESSGVEGGVATGSKALSLLLNPSMRDRILDDIYELEGFLRQRITEASNPQESMIALNLWDEAPKSLRMVSAKHMSSQLQLVEGVLHDLTTPKMTQLFLISTSHRYVDRLTKTLEQQERRSHIAPEKLEALKQKRVQTADQHKLLKVQLNKLKAASKVLTGQIQQAVSEKYKGRPVNIMGVMQSL